MPPTTVWLDSGKRNNVFYVGTPVTLRPTVPGAVSYDVRDYWGNIVDQGPVGTTITPKVTQPGWYKVHLHGSTVQAPWGDSVGDAIFTIMRNNSNFPVLPAPSVSGGADPLLDLVMRGAAAMGPERHSVADVNDPAGAIAKIDAEIALDKQWYANTDPVRPRPLMIAFPNGTSQNLAGVRQIVAHFMNDVKYWEPRNEPNDIPGNQFAVNEMKPFYDTVKSVDPTAKVLGPGVVSISLLPWIEQFLQGGGGQCIDAFSFHAYGNVNGDVWLARKCLDDLNTLLTKYGVQNLEKWQTEQGYFAASYGVYQPRLNGRWTMVQMMAYEQYGIPKEHNNYWYDRCGGFWDFPAWWSNEDGSLNPGAAMMRVWSEELYGKKIVQILNFGTPGNQLYIGSQFAGSGKQVYVLMSTGATDGSVELNVPGVNAIHVVSSFGVEQDVPVVNGKVTIPVPETPVYVETPATLTVTPLNYGKNLTQTAGVTASANSVGGSPPAGSPDPALLVNNFLESSYYGANDVWRCNTQSFPAWVDITFPAPTTMDHVIIYAAPPWSLRGSLLDYDLQYQNASGQWVTLQTVTEPTKTFQAYSPINRTNEDSFYSDRWVFQHAFAPITTQKLRVFVRDVTYGGDATLEAINAGGQGGPHQITLREIEVYNVGTTTTTSPLAPTATPDTVATTTGTPVTINALANDTNPGTGALSIQSVTAPSNGTAVIANNQIVYTPNAGFNGTDWLNYTVTNGSGTASTSVTITVAPAAGTGTGLNGDYFSDQTLTTLKLSRTDATVNFDWGTGAPNASLPVDHFSVRWTGQVQPLYSETYTFYTTSDDGIRVWVNGQQLINNWTDHAPVENSGTIALVAGQKYDIKVEYYENTQGAVARLLWSSPSQAKQTIPQTQLYPAAATVTPPPTTTPPATGAGTGLKGDYFLGQTLSTLKLSRPDAAVNFNWNSVAPDPSLPFTNYSVRWTGQVQPLYSETYTFTTTSDDGIRVWVNGQQLINNWTDHAPVDNSGNIALVAGQKYDIKVEFYQNAGGAVAQLYWSSPSQAKQVIPQAQLYAAASTVTPNQPPVAVNDTATTNESTAVTINVLANDSDPDSGPSPLSVTSIGKASNGVTAPVNGMAVYTPNAGFVGTDSFTYTVSDGAATASGIVTVTVNSTALASNLTGFGLTGAEIGTGSIGSGRVLADSSWEINSASSGIAGTSDACHFESQTQTGDFQIVAKINSLTSASANARAGVMIRESLDPSARCVTIGATTGNQYRYAARTTGGGNVTEAAATGTYTFPNAWVMLQRVGDTITITESSDNVTYRQESTFTLPGLAATVNTGLFTTSGLQGTSARAVVTNYEVLPITSGATATAQGLLGQYFDNSSGTPQLLLQRTDATVNFDWGTGSPDPSIPVDHFTARWTGKVQPLYSETYTFTTTSDDGIRLWVNGQQIINNWTDHAPVDNSGTITLVAGQKYDIVLEYYENTGGAVTKLSWSSPSQAKQIIPQSQLSSPALPPAGLKGNYFADQTLTTLKLTRTDATVNFDWGTGSPDPALPVDHFSARWTGQVKAPSTGTYTFLTSSDDGVRLWVNNQLLIDNWTDHAPVENSGTIALQSGQQYSIRLEYYENAGGAVSKLLWTPPGQTKQVVPSSVLTPQ